MVKLTDTRWLGVTGPTRKAERFQLDYTTWRAHLGRRAAPGCRVGKAAGRNHLDTVIHRLARPAVGARA